jgi:glutathione S-transferase
MSADVGIYKFYGAEISYFSAKVRPALRYKQLHYAELIAAGDNMRRMIEKTGVHFIPALELPGGEFIQDTSVILDWLEANHPEPPLEPSSPVQRVVARLFELYADEFMVLPAMHYRWGTEEGETKARGDFSAMSGNPKASGRFADQMSGSLTALGVVPETAKVIEAHLADLLQRFSEHLGEHGYLLGDAPSLADCSMMGPLYAHLYLDAVPGRLLRATAIPVCHWIERMNHPDPDHPGSWPADDALPSSLRPLLELIGRDALPVLLDAVSDFERWVDEQADPPDELPRAVGFHETGFRGVRFQRYTSTYAPWMVQRVLDVYAELGDADRAAVATAIEGTGCEALLEYTPRHRVGKRANKLILER